MWGSLGGSVGKAGGSGGSALDRVEEGGGPADGTDGGDGGVGAGALLGHARQAKVRQPRLAARVEEDVARLDLQAISAQVWWRCLCLWQGFPMGEPSLPSMLTATHPHHRLLPSPGGRHQQRSQASALCAARVHAATLVQPCGHRLSMALYC